MAKILVALCVAMKDGRLHRRRAWLRQLAVGAREIENGTIARRDPALSWFGANQADGAVERFVIFRSLHEASTESYGAGPTVKKSRLVIERFFETWLVHDNVGIGHGHCLRSLRRC